MAAKKKAGTKRKRMGRYIRGKVQRTLDLGTLAAKTLIGTTLEGTVNERTLVSSYVATHSLGDLAVSSGDGPITVGIAHGDYTDTEIEAFIENAGSWNERDKISQEIGRRKIRTIGTFEQLGSNQFATLNDGKPIRTKLNWILTQGQTLRMWAYNQGDSALATNDPDYTVTGHVNLWPR